MKLTLWPVSLTDFLSRKLPQHLEMQSFLLDPDKLADPVNGQAKPQALGEDALPLDTDPLHALIRVNEINAQRGLGESDGADIDPESTKDYDSQKLSDQLRTYYTKHLDPFQTPDVADLAALQAIEAAQEAFDKRLHESFADAFMEVEGMGYPGVTDPKLKITSKLKTVDGLDHDAAVSFEIQMVSKAGAAVPILRLPESYNGLSQFFTRDWCQVTQTLSSSVPLPSQVNFVASNCVALVPISGSMARPRAKVPSTVPSFGATP